MVTLGKSLIDDEHIVIGENVVLTTDARRQGVYLIGTTGTGKTTLLENIACQDMDDSTKPALIYVDPHGDAIDALLERIPEKRRDDVILFAPGDKEQIERPLGLNIFDCDRNDAKQVNRVSSTVISTLHKLFAYSWGPRMEELLRNSVRTLLEKPDTTFLELLLLMVGKVYRESVTTDIKDPILRHFWKDWFAGYSNDRQLMEVTSSSVNKISRFLTDPLMRNIVSQRRNTLNIRRIMDEGKILLVNLSKGDLGEDNSALLGSVLVNLILIAALTRRDIPERERHPVHLIVDEYQNFATESFPTLQSEARKYAIDVICAHQYRDQLDDLNKGSTLNVANFIVMRVSGRDAHELASQFDNTPPPADTKMEADYFELDDGSFVQEQTRYSGETFYHEVELPRRAYNDVQAEQANRLSNLPNRGVMARLMVDNRPLEFSFKTLPLTGKPNPEMADYIRKRSASLGTPHTEVEADIEERMKGTGLDDLPGYG